MRPSGAASQPHNPEEVNDSDPDAIENAIFRGPSATRPVIDRHRIYRSALTQHERRQKPMHVVEKGQI
jgi:hypothetical protein